MNYIEGETPCLPAICSFTEEGLGATQGDLNRSVTIIFMESIKSYLNKIKHEENILPILFAVAFTTVSFVDSNFFGSKLILVIWIILGTVITGLISWLFVLAGFTVLKSLFLLSAELSLMIFLAQAYCDVPNHVANDALKMLVGVSLLYISFEFFKSLKKALTERLEKVPKKRWSKEKVVVVCLFAIFTFVFVWMIYQVVNPIISNLCIY